MFTNCLILYYISSRKNIVMMDWEFEKEQDIQEEFENFLEYLELREWEKYCWNENSNFLLSIEEHKFSSNIDEIDYLKRSSDGWLFLNGYATNPLRIKRNKYQKLKKNYEKLS